MVLHGQCGEWWGGERVSSIFERKEELSSQVLPCVCSGLLQGRPQYGVRSVRRALGWGEPQPTVHVVHDDWGTEEDWVRTILDHSTAPGKFQQGQWRVLEPELPLEESRTAQE